MRDKEPERGLDAQRFVLLPEISVITGKCTKTLRYWDKTNPHFKLVRITRKTVGMWMPDLIDFMRGRGLGAA